MYTTHVRLPDSLVKGVERTIIYELDKIGLFYRVFSRVKSEDSIERKMTAKQYSTEKKMQDLLGIRIVLYFNDDIEICEKIISRLYEKVGESRDTPDASTFEPTRTNIVYRLDTKISKDIEFITTRRYIDNTFELQLRTVFSEGWHEVEHDLRYKCKDEWESYAEQSRTLNGLVATLENCDWSILRLFSDLAYRNYKDENLMPMIRNKFRIRLNNEPLNELIEVVLKENKLLAKEIFRLERDTVLNEISKLKISIDLTFDNIVYLSNYHFLHNDKITEMTPAAIIKLLHNASA